MLVQVLGGTLHFYSCIGGVVVAYMPESLKEVVLKTHQWMSVNAEDPPYNKTRVIIMTLSIIITT